MRCCHPQSSAATQDPCCSQSRVWPQAGLGIAESLWLWGETSKSDPALPFRSDFWISRTTSRSSGRKEQVALAMHLLHQLQPPLCCILASALHSLA